MNFSEQINNKDGTEEQCQTQTFYFLDNSPPSSNYDQKRDRKYSGRNNYSSTSRWNQDRNYSRGAKRGYRDEYRGYNRQWYQKPYSNKQQFDFQGRKLKDRYEHTDKLRFEDLSTDYSNENESLGDSNIDYPDNFVVKVGGRQILDTTVSHRRNSVYYRKSTKFAAASNLKPPEPTTISVPNLE